MTSRIVIIGLFGLGVTSLFAIVGAASSTRHAAAVAAAALPTSGAGLHVQGNRLVDGHGRVVVLRGVNRSGTEYACVHQTGVFDGPSSAASVHAIAAWGATLVRIPINEDCWLGINGVNAAFAGRRYRDAILRYVTLAHRYGMYAEIALVWAAPGRHQATYQPAAPDADHAPAVWASLGGVFASDAKVILAPWGETTVTAACFLRGGVCGAAWGAARVRYKSAGMAQAVGVLRHAGYRGVIAIPGTNYANDLSSWLGYQPRDPLRQLVAEAHIYGNQTCSDTACFDATIRPVADRVPVVFGEVGESYDGSDCAATNIRRILGWAHTHHVSYAAWTWDTWSTCSALVASYTGTPANAYGAFIRHALETGL